MYINTDQHGWDAISAPGNPWLETPAIDRMRRNGISFERTLARRLLHPRCESRVTHWAGRIKACVESDRVEHAAKE